MALVYQNSTDYWKLTRKDQACRDAPQYALEGTSSQRESNDSSSKDLATPSKAPRSPSPHKSQEMWIAFSTCGKQIQVRKNCPLALQCKRQRSRVQLFYLISPTLSSSKLKNIDLSEPGPFPPCQRKLVSKQWPTHLIYKAGMWAAPCRALRASYPGTRFSSAEWETDKAKQQAYR